MLVNTESRESDSPAIPLGPVPVAPRPSVVAGLVPSVRRDEMPVPVPQVACPPRAWGWWLVLLLVVGLGMRAGLSLRRGMADDLELFEAWLRTISTGGLSNFFTESGANYPPLHLLTLRAQGWLLQLAGVDLADGSTSALIRYWLRAPACLADMLIAILLFVEGRRRIGGGAGLAAAALYYLNPVALYTSAYWGQVDSIHTLFILAGLIVVGRSRSWLAGGLTGLALLQKFQAVAFVPLLIFDVYRWRRWPGVLGFVAGLGLAASVVLAPYLYTNTATTALRRGYVDVLGQYPRLSINAYNLWHIGDHHLIGDRNPPRLLVRAAAGGEPSVAEDAVWYLGLTWRRIGSILFVLLTATVLSLYGRRFRDEDRYLAAGALGLCFFLFPTEMHERYAYPVIGVLVLWAVREAWRERLYVLFSALLLLNLTGPLPVTQIAGDIGVAVLIVFAAMLILLSAARGGFAPVTTGAAVGVSTVTSTAAAATAPSAVRAEPAAGVRSLPSAAFPSATDSPLPASRLVKAFQVATFFAWVVVLNTTCVLVYKGATTPWPAERGAIYLSQLEPVEPPFQRYRSPQADAEVEGGILHVGDRYYLRGLGTHAPSRLVYAVPEGVGRFRAVAGVSRYFEGRVRIRVLLDQQPVFESPVLTEHDVPVSIDIDVRGAKRLTLITEPIGGMTGDHVDLCDARFLP